MTFIASYNFDVLPKYYACCNTGGNVFALPNEPHPSQHQTSISTSQSILYLIYTNTPDMLTSTRQVNIFLLSNIDALARVANSQYKQSTTCHSIPISDCNILNQTGITDSVNCQGSNKKQGFERWGILKEQLCQVLFQLSKNYSVSNPSIQCFKANYMSHEHPQIILIRLPG